MDFYEEYTINLSDEQQEKFFAENPDFLSGYSIDRNKIKLLRDPIYIGLMRKIKKYEEYRINLPHVHWLFSFGDRAKI